jgi:hypothetical protein
MLSHALKSLPPAGYHDAPLELILDLILEALSRETIPDVLTMEMFALAKFCIYCFDPQVHDPAPILTACDHFVHISNPRIIVSCYVGLISAKVALTERGIYFLIGILREPQDRGLFFRVLGEIDLLLRAFPVDVVPVVEGILSQFVSSCDIDALNGRELRPVHALLCVMGHQNPDAVLPYLSRLIGCVIARVASPVSLCDGRFNNCETVIDRGVAVHARVEDLHERKELLLNLDLFLRSCRTAAEQNTVALGELVRVLLGGPLWGALLPATLKLVRTALRVCAGLADSIVETLVDLIRARPAESSQAIRTLAVAVAHLSFPDAPAILEFARSQIHPAAMTNRSEARRGKALGDVRDLAADFDRLSVEFALVRLIRAPARSPGYTSALSGLLNCLIANEDPFAAKIGLMLAPDYVQRPDADTTLIEAVMAFCVAQLAIDTDHMCFLIAVMAAMLVRRTFSAERFAEVVTEMMSKVTQRDVAGTALTALLCVVGVYKQRVDCRIIEDILVESEEEVVKSWRSIGRLFPDELALALTGVLSHVDLVSVRIGKRIGGELLMHKELGQDARGALERALHTFDAMATKLSSDFTTIAQGYVPLQQRLSMATEAWRPGIPG